MFEIFFPDECDNRFNAPLQTIHESQVLKIQRNYESFSHGTDLRSSLKYKVN